MEQTQASRVMDALGLIESGLNSLDQSAAEMRKSLGSVAHAESEKLFDEVRKIARHEGDSIVKEARLRADSESEKTKEDGKKKLNDIQKDIDANFSDAVDYVVARVLQ